MGKAEDRMGTLYRRDNKRWLELITLRKIAQDGDEYRKWINGPTKYLKLNLRGEEDREDRGKN